jgi:hypothetical protein
MTTQPKPLVHSFSSLKYFQGCPRKYAEVKIFKHFTEPPFVATELGKILHAAFERAITMGVALPDNLIKYTLEVEMLKALSGAKHCELDLALTHTGEPTGYWDKNAWMRGSADFVNIDGDHAIIADWKTGKVRVDADQLHAMAMMVFKRFPNVQKIRGVLVFVEFETIHTENYVRENFDQMWQVWAGRMNRVEKAIATNNFPPSPSGLCKNHCCVKSCEHNGDALAR